MRIAVKLAAASMALALAGCSTISSWNPFADKPDPKTLPAPLVELKPTLAVTTAWSATVGEAGSNVFAPAFAAGSVFAAAADGTLARFDAASGRSVWRINAGTPLTAGVGSDGQLVVVAGAKGNVLAFDADGKQLWKAQASSEILSAPAVGQGVVVVRSQDNRITGYDAANGAKRWTVQRTTPALTLRTAPGIVIAGQNVYVALPGGRMVALAVSNGGARWEATVGEPRGATELERVSDIAGAPVVVERDVCAVTFQGKIGCFDVSNGAQRWAKDFSSVAGVAADQRFVFAVNVGGLVHGFTRDGGASVWSNKQLTNRLPSTPVSVGRAVAMGDYQGYIHFLSREDGSMLARVATDGSAIIAPPALTGDGAVFQTRAGTVIALRSE